MIKRPAKKRRVKKTAKSEGSGSALEGYTRALDRHSVALDRHSLALSTLSATTLQACVLKSLDLTANDLDTPFSKLWPFDITKPIDHIDDACSHNHCYRWTLPELKEKLSGKSINTLREFIDNV